MLSRFVRSVPKGASKLTFQTNLSNRVLLQQGSTTVKSLISIQKRHRGYKSEYDEFDPDFEMDEPKNFALTICVGLLAAITGFAAGLSVAWNNPNANASDEEDEEVPSLDDGGVYNAELLKTFEHFADIEEGGEKFLSSEAFVRSLLMPKPDTPAWVAYPRKDGELVVDKKMFEDKDLQVMFSFADVNADRKISFPEYDLFITLLSLNPHQFSLAFRMFDADGNGFIDANEFKNVLQANKKHQGPVDSNNSIMQYFFGPNQDRKVSFSDFIRFVNKCKDTILKLEFLQHDIEGRGAVSVEAFSELMTNSPHFNTINDISHFKKQLNLLKTNGFFKPSGRVDYDTYKAFRVMSERIDDISFAMQLYTSGGNAIGRDTFTRAVKNVGIVDIPSRVVDLVFALYDSDNNGTLDWKEFTTALHRKKGNEGIVEKLSE
ncbi:calcium uptake protein 1, mitochondrial [Acrasis kona]|uniref:Calcium uptake protein 1, mitochondrial n=1 Tax=Acrasis kona TaxID=1008807 RepID=A0AAW2ZMS4_9EUKA